MTSNPDEGMRWLARSLGWEQSLVRLRHSVLADAAAAATPELPAMADEPVVELEPAGGPERTEPVGESASRAHARRQSDVHLVPRPRGPGVVVGREGARAGVRRSA